MTVEFTISVTSDNRKVVVKVPRQDTAVLYSGQFKEFTLPDCEDTVISVVEHPHELPEAQGDDEAIFDADLNGEDDGVTKGEG